MSLTTWRGAHGSPILPPLTEGRLVMAAEVGADGHASAAADVFGPWAALVRLAGGGTVRYR